LHGFLRFGFDVRGILDILNNRKRWAGSNIKKNLKEIEKWLLGEEYF
jgi:hypothetical protein